MLRLYPIETHLAEKLHAYTMPRSRPNSRVKDLPDIALLATAQPIDAQRLRAALEQTFTFRKTHALPAKVPAPLGAWTTPYAAMAREDQLAWLTLDEVTTTAQTFLDPVLAGAFDATWEPERWSWRLHQSEATSIAGEDPSGAAVVTFIYAVAPRERTAPRSNLVTPLSRAVRSRASLRP